jgi:hypothetical protein
MRPLRVVVVDVDAEDAFEVVGGLGSAASRDTPNGRFGRNARRSLSAPADHLRRRAEEDATLGGALGWGRNCGRTSARPCGDLRRGISWRSLRLDPADQRKGKAVPAFEVVLRRPNVADRICYRNRGDAEIGDVVTITGRPWIVIAKDPPFELRRIERIICVPRLVRHR